MPVFFTQKRGIIMMQPGEIDYDSKNIREQCKKKRKEIDKTYTEVANESKVPIGTVNRFFGSGTGEFRPSTTAAIARSLGLNVMDEYTKNSPIPAPDIISLLQGRIEEFRAEVAEQKEIIESERESTKATIDTLRNEYEMKINHVRDDKKMLETDKANLYRQNKILLSALILLIVMVFVLVIIDFFNPDKGWIVHTADVVTNATQKAFVIIRTFIEGMW